MEYYLHYCLSIAVLLGVSSCSHRNRDSKAATQKKLIQSVASTDLHTFLLSNQAELYRFSLDLSAEVAVDLPAEVKNSLYPLSLAAAGSRLYLLSQHLHSSEDQGKTWTKLALPPHGMNMKCFSVDPAGQLLIGYHDGLWYSRHPAASFQQLDSSRVDDCSISGPLLMIAHQSRREIRSIPDGFHVLSTIPGYGITAKNEENHEFYLVSSMDQRVFLLSRSAPMETLSIAFFQGALLDLAINEDNIVMLSSDTITWVDRESLAQKSLVRTDEQRILLQGEQVLLLGADRLSLMIEGKVIKQITLTEDGLISSEAK